MRNELVVIGGGPAGVTAALRARELGARVALVERGAMGGTCTNDGCAPTRVLAKTARLLRDASQFEEYGLEGAPPELNWERLLARTSHVVNALHEKKQLIAHLAEAGVETYTGVGDAHFTDPHTLALEDGTRLTANKFILCAGGHARRLPFPGAEHALTHSDVWSLRTLPKRVAIVGGAATGCQLASVLLQFGSVVTLLDVAPRILPVEDELTSRTIEREFTARGMTIETGIGGIARIERGAGGLKLIFVRDSEEHARDVDAVIVAVGWVASLELLNLDAAGVETARGYVRVNDALQTSAPHIFAAGDITGRMMLVQSATQEGLVAAENAVQETAQTLVHKIVPHGGFTDPEYGSVGLTEAQAQVSAGGSGTLTATVAYAEMDRAVIDDATTGFFKLVVARDTRKVLGAHAVGEQALEITQIIAAAMAAEAQVSNLAALEIGYPTYGAIVGLAARRVVRELGEVGTEARWGTLGRVPAAEWERREMNEEVGV